MLAPGEHNHSSFARVSHCLFATPTMTLLSRDLRAEWWVGGVSARDKSRARSAYGSPFVIRITERMASQFKNGMVWDTSCRKELIS